MKRAVLIRVVAAVVLAVFVAGAWLTNGRLDLGWVRFFSTAVLAATLLLGAWDLWLWRLPAVQRIPGVPRRLRGTWQGTLTSFWPDPAAGGAHPPPKTVYLVVHQTATLISVKLLTDQARSSSVLGDLSVVDSTPVLTYVYRAQPDLRHAKRNPMHHGSTVLTVSGRPPSRLKGRYWTDRDSKGELDFEHWRPELADDYDEAKGYFTP
jgi:SMODS-associating 2TM, beta-strand rich effector domain